MESLWLFQLTRLFVSAIFRLYFQVEYQGLENVPQEGALIFAPNHASYLDPIWVSIPIERPLRYMTWDKMTRKPLLGWLIRAYGAFPVKVANGRGDRAALRHSLDHLRAGGGLMIFPEGARTRNGKLMPFKPGVIRLALDTNAPIVPVTIIGGYDAYAPHHLIPRPHKLKIVYHEPIRLTPSTNDSRDKEYERIQAGTLRSKVASALPRECLPEIERSAIESG